MAIKQVTTSIIFSGENILPHIAKAIESTFKSKDCSLSRVLISKNKDKYDVEIVTANTFTVFKFGQYYQQSKQS